MKPSEFYSKHWKVTLPNGKVVSPPPLTEVEASYMDEVCSGNPDLQSIYYGRKRGRPLQIDIVRMKEDMNKLPDFLKPTK